MTNHFYSINVELWKEWLRSKMVGKIIKLSPKGWGFIVSKELPFTRIFFHWSNLEQETLHFTKLERGMEVEFEPIHSEEKGYRATKIWVLEPKEIEKDDIQREVS